jgi:hypothetical protein
MQLSCPSSDELATATHFVQKRLQQWLGDLITAEASK